MRKTIIAAAIVSAAATFAATPAQADTLSPERFAEKYTCTTITGVGWIDGVTQALSKPHTIKTSVYSIPADGTALIRKGTNHATQAAIIDQGRLRFTCTERVPFGTRAAWS